MLSEVKKILTTFIEGSKKTPRKPKQPKSEGEGPTYRRTYQVKLNNTEIDPTFVFEDFKQDINAFVPSFFVKFEKTKGKEGLLKIGDEFFANITGPWNSPTKVIDVTPHSFTFQTLKGSVEAGTIKFGVYKEGKGWTFKIESSARSRDSLIDTLYDKIPLIKAGQTMMWYIVCRKFASACDPRGKVHVKVSTKTN